MPSRRRRRRRTLYRRLSTDWLDVFSNPSEINRFRMERVWRGRSRKQTFRNVADFRLVSLLHGSHGAHDSFNKINTVGPSPFTFHSRVSTNQTAVRDIFQIIDIYISFKLLHTFGFHFGWLGVGDSSGSEASVNDVIARSSRN